ncbi:hypothetical protein MXB_1615 [Myxobolus squamalis]|nr:hypothetical protein MXB_1615 [Myxobolus squamalis]
MDPRKVNLLLKSFPILYLQTKKSIERTVFNINVIFVNEEGTINSLEKMWNKRKIKFFVKYTLSMIDAAIGDKTDDKKRKFRNTGMTLAMILGAMAEKLIFLYISVKKYLKIHL